MSIFDKIFGRNKSDAEVNGTTISNEENPSGSTKDSIPTNFPDAVKFIIEERGSSCIDNKVFINILNDFHVLKEIPSLKNILRNMQEEGYITKLLQLSNWELESRSLCAQYIKDYGAKENIVAYIVSSVGYGLNKVSVFPKYIEASEEIKESGDVFDPSTQSISFKEDEQFSSTMSISASSPQQPNPSQPYDPKNSLPNYVSPTVDLLTDSIDSSILSIKSILDTEDYHNSQMDLPCAIGKKSDGSILLFDLTGTPHILISGASGMGVSVFFNTLVTSLLYKKHPAELKMVFIDPKKIEFSLYNPLTNYFLATIFDEEPIVSDMSKVPDLFRSLCKEMDNRYDLLKKAGTRNIRDYNRKFCNRQLAPDKGHCYMPYIVVFVDEYDEIIRITGKETEDLLDRIVRMSRAIGIHMVISVQRPVGTVISNDIKSNITTRISFRVTSSNDSRNILGVSGAEKLRLPGEMLYFNGADLIKAQCAYIDTDEIDKINNYIISQEGFPYEHLLPNPEEEVLSNYSVDMQHLDPLFEDAAKYIVANQQVSTSLLQRKFAIGYNRTGRLMTQLRYAGIIGGGYGSKPLKVLIGNEYSLKSVLDSINKNGIQTVNVTSWDPLFEEAARLVVINQSGSTSLLQRKFAIGYNRAGLIMDQLEMAGVVGAAIGSKPRDVLIPNETRLNSILNSLR